MIKQKVKSRTDIIQDSISGKMLVSAEDIQDEIFRKMPVEKKLSLLDEFFRFGKKLQSLNDKRITKF